MKGKMMMKPDEMGKMMGGKMPKGMPKPRGGKSIKKGKK